VDRWWIDQPALLGSCDLDDADLAFLREAGFSVIVCLLDPDEGAPSYDVNTARASGWEWHNIPVPDFAAPTLEQIEEFLTLIGSLVPEKKVVVHCRGGMGRTGTMAAAYWIEKGLPWQKAIAHTRERQPYAVENRHQEEKLREFDAWRASRGPSS
jgi:protein-tyrosine phosphatase